MLEQSSNRELLAKWRQGNEHAADILVRRYMTRLTALVRTRLSERLARRVDADDVTMSAWRSFFVAVERSRFRMADTEDVWPFLVTIALRKLRRQVAVHYSDKRNLLQEQRRIDDAAWISIASNDPTPSDTAAVADLVEAQMRLLSDRDREVMSRLLCGNAQNDIARTLGCDDRTVRRSVARIRSALQQLAEQPEEPSKDIRHGPRTLKPEPAPERHRSLSTQAVKSDAEVNARFTVLAEELRIQRFVGQGGSGRVYRAAWRQHDDPVAVKFLHKRLWRHPGAVRQLIHEHCIVRRLRHPGIVQHFALGRTHAGATFIVMEWLEGTTLERWVQRHQPSLPDIVAAARDTAVAIAAAHEAGVIHCDLTPANVFRNPNGQVVVTDFGFARVRSTGETQIAGGTAGFLAPEQIADCFGTPSERTDVYGIGGLLYFMLTGNAPARGGHRAAILADTLSSREFLLPDIVRHRIPGALGHLVMQCLAKEPDTRPSSVSTIVESLAMIDV